MLAGLNPRASRKSLWIAVAGWVTAIGLGLVLLYLLPRLRLRILNRPQPWELSLQRKQKELESMKWQDSRSLMVWIGDSHVALGDWYNLFGGAYAIRNCGMSMATIRDVDRLVKSIPERTPKLVVSMCGINNLLHGESVETCLRDYEALLSHATDSLHPKGIVVLAVLPVRKDFLGSNAAAINLKVKTLNSGLEKLCAKAGYRLFNANPSVEAADGGLNHELTDDGLHLNSRGYRILSEVLRTKLSQ